MAGRPRFHSLRVSEIDHLTGDAVAITFDVPPDLRDDYAFEPGQHVTLRCVPAGDDKRRTYSVCSPPGTLRVGVKKVAGGVFSRHALAGLAVGDDVEVMTPTGRFTTELDPARARHRAAIVAGSGITPVLSIARATLEAEPKSRFTLVYGNRDSGSIMFLDEIADLKDRFPERLVVFHALSREPRDSALLSGRLDRAKIEYFLGTVIEAAGVDEWFLCGPMPVIDAARAALRTRGVSDSAVRYELFHLAAATPGPTADSGRASSADVSHVTITLAGRTTSLLVGRDSDILHAALAVRPDVPYGCTNGMCGTCRARVVEGKVQMRHCYALDERDLAAGFVVTCQALPRAEAVVLDYDA